MRQALRDHLPEIGIVALGVLLRLILAETYPASAGYDFRLHWQHVDYIAHWGELPPYALNNTATHPPLFYLAGAALVRFFGATPDGVRMLSVIAGTARLLVLFHGLRCVFPDRQLVRVVALAMAALLASSLHLDVMLTNEAFSNLFCTVALLAGWQLFRSEGRRRWRYGVMLGLALAGALLSKISAVVLLPAVAVAMAFDLARAWRTGHGPALARLRQYLAPWLLASLAFAACTGWYFARNLKQAGKLTVMAYDDSKAKQVQAPFERIPYLQRRSPGYVLGWDAAIFTDPYFPTGTRPTSHFWPVLVASTFIDYYNFQLRPPPPPGAPTVKRNVWSIGQRALALSRPPVWAGTLIYLVVAVAWAWAFAVALRDRDPARLFCLLAPPLAVLGQLHFAIKYPEDGYGPVKGIYVQFASAPLYALFGVAVDRTWRSSRTRPLALVCLAALATISGYSLYCVLGRLV